MRPEYPTVGRHLVRKEANEDTYLLQTGNTILES